MSSGPFDGIPWGYAEGGPQSVTEEQMTALEIYTLNADRINGALRGTVVMTSALLTQIRLIRSALMPARTEFRVSRGMPLSGLDSAATHPTATVGRVFEDAAFLSVSGKRDPPPQTTRAPGSIVLELLVSEGVGVRSVRQFAEFPLEDELIVIDNAAIYVVGSQFDERLKLQRLFGTVEAQ